MTVLLQTMSGTKPNTNKSKTCYKRSGGGPMSALLYFSFRMQDEKMETIKTGLDLEPIVPKGLIITKKNPLSDAIERIYFIFHISIKYQRQ